MLAGRRCRPLFAAAMPRHFAAFVSPVLRHDVFIDMPYHALYASAITLIYLLLLIISRRYMLIYVVALLIWLPLLRCYFTPPLLILPAASCFDAAAMMLMLFFADAAFLSSLLDLMYAI